MRYLLAYDAECGPCSAFRSLVGFLDPGRRVGFVSLRAADALGILSAVEPRRRYSSFHLVSDGETWSGADAVIPLVRAVVPRGQTIVSVAGRNRLARRLVAFGYGTLSRLHGVGACAAGG